MSKTHVALGLGLLIGLFTLAAEGRADVPGPREVCDTDGLACESCWQHYGTSPEDAAAFDKCKEPLVAKGYTEGCRQRQGAGDTVFFCAPGAAPQKVTQGAGCRGCEVGSGAGSSALLAVAAGLAGIAWRRRKGSRRGG